MFFQRKADRSRSVVPLFLFFVRQFLPIVRCLSCGTFQFLSRMRTRRERVVAVNVLVDERNADDLKRPKPIHIAAKRLKQLFLMGM